MYIYNTLLSGFQREHSGFQTLWVKLASSCSVSRATSSVLKQKMPVSLVQVSDLATSQCWWNKTRDDMTFQSYKSSHQYLKLHRKDRKYFSRNMIQSSLHFVTEQLKTPIKQVFAFNCKSLRIFTLDNNIRKIQFKN